MKQGDKPTIGSLIFIALGMLMVAGIILGSVVRNSREAVPVIAYLTHETSRPALMITSDETSDARTSRMVATSETVILLDDAQKITSAPATTVAKEESVLPPPVEIAEPVIEHEPNLDPDPVETQPPQMVVNINTADSAQLETLKGIGPVKANAIIAYREEFGSFISIEEIMDVKGIGVKTFENIREWICVE